MSESGKTSIHMGGGNSILGLASVIAGGYHGYANARGIPLEATLDWWVSWGPTVVQAGLGAVTGALGGGILGLVADDYNPIRSGTTLAAVGAGTGAAIGAAKGGIETVIGYGIGYGIGYLVGKQ